MKGLDMSGSRKKQLTEFEKNFILRTRNARRMSGFNQSDMAESLGIPRPTYANYELDRIMDIQLLQKFCELTNTSVEFIVTGRENPVLEAYNRLDPDSKERLAVDQFLRIDDQPSAAPPSEPVTKKAAL